MQSSRNHLTSLQLQRRASSASWDPFAVNPVRRSLVAFLLCTAAFIVPMAVFPPSLEALAMVLFGWVAAIGMVLTLPIFLISLIEMAWTSISHRVHPSVDLLDLSPRVRNLLRRYRFSTIDSLDRTHDDALLMLSNFDPKAVHEVRRAINIWKYRRWQDAGFPADWV